MAARDFGAARCGIRAYKIGDVATVVKLTRNLAILPVRLGATWLVARSERAAAMAGEGTVRATSTSRLTMVSRAVPWFVVGFVVVVIGRKAAESNNVI